MTEHRSSRPLLTAAAKRYFRGIAVASALYVALTAASAYVMRAMHLTGGAAIAVALMPMLAALGILRVYLILLREVDEFQRRVQTEAVLIAAGVVAFGTFGYGFLEVWAGFPRLTMFMVLPARAGVWGLANIFLRWRYR